MNLSDITNIERATLAAVSPQTVEELPGWLLPFDTSSVGRALSAVPLSHDFEQGGAVLVANIEARYVALKPCTKKQGLKGLGDKAIYAILAVMLIGLPVQSAPLYKCEINGELAFQDTPCPPVKAKQKIACADVDGFAVYKDSLSGECKNLPAGNVKNNDISANKKATNTKSTKASYKTANSKKTGKEVRVRAYTKEDGTQVPSHTRSLPGDTAK
jgi:hypothetical protein